MRLLEQMQTQYEVLNNKARFVRLVILQELKVLGQKKLDVENQLITLQFAKIDNDFKYLMSLSISQFTLELSDKLFQ